MSEFEQVQPATAVDYDLSKPALLFASSPGRMRRAEDALVATGVRLVGSCSIEDAARRLEAQASLGLAWVELGEEDDTRALDAMLSRLNEFAETRGTSVVASTPIELVDVVAAKLTDRSTEILVDA